MISTSSPYKLLILTPAVTPRLRYVIEHIAGLAGISDVQYSNHMVDRSGEIVIAYGMLSDVADVTIPSAGLLSEVGIRPVELNVNHHQKLPYFFGTEALGYTYDFDMLSMIFYLLTRYEEYGDYDQDQHGRYKSEHSLAVQHNFLERPIVDLWIKRLFAVLSEKAGMAIDFKGDVANRPSVDIDMPYAYKYKGHKAYTGILRDIATRSMSSINARMNYWRSGVDPFDTYSYIVDTFAQAGLSPHFFILNRYQPPHDENHLAQSALLVPILAKLAIGGPIGYHPSIASHRDEGALMEEIDSLKQLTITKAISRQHFIKLQMPQTYQLLVNQGVREDHSMVYPDRIGYRASTSHPYRWYDLEHERETELLLHPYAVMDVTLRYHMKLTPEQAIDRIRSLAQDIKEVNGSLGWIWHNSSLSQAYGWGPWRPVFEHLTLLSPHEST